MPDNSPRLVEVPEGLRAIFISDEMVAHFADWREIPRCQAKITACNGSPVRDYDILVDAQIMTLSEDEG